ncbi:Uncharacterised protein [Mycobacteroides abscessus subsp. abscessus]|nr:Uncharacterised protein [Mycobacteroides abscessus subsp. abscessus]
MIDNGAGLENPGSFRRNVGLQAVGDVYIKALGPYYLATVVHHLVAHNDNPVGGAVSVDDAMTAAEGPASLYAVQDFGNLGTVVGMLMAQ